MRHDQADGKILPLVERRSHFDKTASHDQKVKTNSSRPSSVWIDASQIGRAPNKQLFGTLIKLGSKALCLKVIYGSTQYLILFESSTLNQLSPISLWLRINLLGCFCSQLNDSVWLFCSKTWWFTTGCISCLDQVSFTGRQGSYQGWDCRQGHIVRHTSFFIWTWKYDVLAEKKKSSRHFLRNHFVCVCFLTFFCCWHFWVSFSFHFIGVEFGVGEVCRLPNPHYVVVRLGFLENLTKGDIPQQRTTTPYNCDTRHSLQMETFKLLICSL